MLDAFASTVSAFVRETLPSFMRQTLPSLVATLIAAVVIAGYNHTFHLTQPRMAALQSVGGGDQAPAAQAAPATTSVVPMTKTAGKPVTEYITIHEVVFEPDHRAEKGLQGELGKDPSVPKEQTAAREAKETPVAKAPLPTPRPVAAAPKVEPRIVERRPELRAPYAQAPVAASPLPVPPAGQPIIIAAPSAGPAPFVVGPAPVPTDRTYVTVPDRPYPQRPAYEANAEDLPPPPPPRGPLGVIVDTLKPSSLFARAREFGEKIEQAGNDILPNIRPQ